MPDGRNYMAKPKQQLGVWRPQRKRGVHMTRRTSLAERWREYVWPSMGLRAYVRWVLLGLRRQAGRPHFVALGFAFGVWTAFFPLLGTHVILLGLLCWVFRASFLASLAGTMLGNPWTYPAIWTVCYRAGRHVLHMPPGKAGNVLHLGEVSFATLVHDVGVLWHGVLFPTMVGGVVVGVPVAAVVYALVYYQLKSLKGKDKR